MPSPEEADHFPEELYTEQLQVLLMVALGVSPRSPLLYFCLPMGLSTESPSSCLDIRLYTS